MTMWSISTAGFESARPSSFSSRRRSALTLQALAGEVVEIVSPIGLPVSAERKEVVPAVDAGRMHIVEDEPHRVIADRVHFEDGDVLLACDGLALIRRMALHFGAGALHAQVFGGEVECLAAVEGDRQGPAALVQAQLRRPGF